MKRYLQKVNDLIQAFHKFDIQQISGMENIQVDALSKLAISVLHDLRAQIFFEIVEEPSIKESMHVLQIDIEPCQIDPLAQYLHNMILLTD